MVEYRPLKKRKHVSPSVSIKRKTGCGNIYIHVNYNVEDFKISRVLVSLGKSGSCRSSQCAGISEMISLLFQGNYDPELIVERLHGINCGTPYIVEDKEDCSMSCCDAISRGIKEALEILKEMEEERKEKDAKEAEKSTAKDEKKDSK